MSIRKPKSVVIRSLEDDSDDNGESGVANGALGDERVLSKSKERKKKRNKIKFGGSFEDEDEDSSVKKSASKWKDTVQAGDHDEDAELDLKLKQKTKEKRNKGLKIPLFEDLDDDKAKFGAVDDTVDDTENLNIQTQTGYHNSDQNETDEKDRDEDEPVIIALPDEDFEDHKDHEDSFIPLEQLTTNKKPLFDTKEYISVVSDAGESSPDDELNEQMYDQLDDGRLPLSNREAELQKKMHDMEIKEAMYDVEISEDEEMADWSANKMREGAGAVGDGTQRRTKALPKLNLLGKDNDTFADQLNKVNETLSSLSTEQNGLVESLKDLDTKSARFELQLAELKKKLELIGDI